MSDLVGNPKDQFSGSMVRKLALNPSSIWKFFYCMIVYSMIVYGCPDRSKFFTCHVVKGLSLSGLDT